MTSSSPAAPGGMAPVVAPGRRKGRRERRPPKASFRPRATLRRDLSRFGAVHADHSGARAVDVGDEKERDRHDERQNHKQEGARCQLARAVAQQNVAEDRDRSHQGPGGNRDSIVPGRLRIALRVQHVVHARDRQRDDGVRLRRARCADRRPQIGLQLAGLCADLPKLPSIAGHVEQDSLIDVAPQQRAHALAIGGREQVGPEIFRSDRVGLAFLKGLAFIVPAHRHRETEADDEAEKRQRGGQDDVVVVARVFPQAAPPSEKGRSARGGKPQHDDRNRHDEQRVVHRVAHGLACRRPAGELAFAPAINARISTYDPDQLLTCERRQTVRSRRGRGRR